MTRRNTSRINMVGKVYNKITVLEEIKERNKNGHILYLCKCECGSLKKILGSSLRSGATTSCGCYNREKVTKHNKWKTKEYACWALMKNRCYNKKNKRYNSYGGRGIKVCDRWINSFENFYEDMGPKPFIKGKRFSIERLDVNGDYEPSNCVWATDKDQARNRRNNNIITIDNKKETFSYWCNHFKIASSTVVNRIKRGLTIEDSFKKPTLKKI